MAGCPEAGFNEFLQFGAETGAAGFALLLLLTGTAVAAGIRRGDPFGYGLLAAAVFASFSYPWSVLPLRLLFVVLLAGRRLRPGGRRRSGPRTETVPSRRSGPFRRIAAPLLLAAGIACWPGVYGRTAARAEARRQWSDVRIWMSSGRYDYPRRGRRTPSRQPAARLPVSLRLRLRPAPERRLPPEQRHPADRGRGSAATPCSGTSWARTTTRSGSIPKPKEPTCRRTSAFPTAYIPLPAGPPLPGLRTGRPEAPRHGPQGRGPTPKIESAQTRKMQEEMRGLLAAARSGPLSET